MEGANATKIIAFSFLNPNGKTFYALVALDSGDQTSKTNLSSIARWIGNARQNYPLLSNQHENELYEWLVDKKGYGTSKSQISSERDFKMRLASIINKRTKLEGGLRRKLKYSR